MNIRILQREEIPLIWQIDRREIIENIFQLQQGRLVLVPNYFDIEGWPPGEAEHYTPILLDCYDRGGMFWAAFEEQELMGRAILENRCIGVNQDTLQLKFLHVSRDHRRHGLGTELFSMAVERAKMLGAKKLYISASPSENTISYYLRLGCVPTTEIDPDLFALEPDDIHLEYLLP